VTDDRPLQDLTDEDLKALADDVGVEVHLPSEESPLAALPLQEADSETPPAPNVLVVPGKYGPGTVGVYLPDGTPVGVWLHNEHPRLDAEGVLSLLVTLGLQESLAEESARHRALRDETAEALALPQVRDFAQAEKEREARLDPIREAFVKAMQKKQK
jgi:hypothetical protein